MSKIEGFYRAKGKSFFTRLNDAFEETSQKAGTKVKSKPAFDWNEFHELFTLRHNIVHYTGSEPHITAKKLSDLVADTRLFLIASQNIVLYEILELKKEELKKKNPKSFERLIKEWEQQDRKNR